GERTTFRKSCMDVVSESIGFPNFEPMQEEIIILDFGSQYTQLIARRVRELNVYCEIHPFNNPPAIGADVKGVILSGSPYSVHQEDAPAFDFSHVHGSLPLLGVCYGAQYMASHSGGTVTPS